MSVKVENLEHNMAKLTVEVPAEEFVQAIQKVYQKNKKSISLPGFRKGHAPLQMIERMYGMGVFYEDAANDCINANYGKAADESGLDIVSSPEIGVEQIEKGKDFIFTALVAVKPEVKLGEYRGLEIEKKEAVVTDEDVEADLKREQEKNSRMIDIDSRPIADGDTIRLDYEGTIDGVPFNGGKAENAELVIGSGMFIPGFEEQLVGVSVNEEKDVEVTFPEDYHGKDVAGKTAVFHCVIHKIQQKELPELNDDFAKDVSEFDTLDEYKEDIRKNLLEQKEKAVRMEKENAAVTKLIEASEMDLPDAMINTQVDRMFMDYSYQLRSQGIPVEDFLRYQGMDEQKLKAQMRPQAVKQIQTRLVLEAVAANEKLEVSEERMKEEIEKMAKAYNMEYDKLAEVMDESEKESMKKDLAVQEAITFITDQAKEVEPAPEKKDAE